MKLKAEVNIPVYVEIETKEKKKEIEASYLLLQKYTLAMVKKAMGLVEGWSKEGNVIGGSSISWSNVPLYMNGMGLDLPQPAEEEAKQYDPDPKVWEKTKEKFLVNEKWEKAKKWEKSLSEKQKEYLAMFLFEKFHGDNNKGEE